MKTCLVTGAAGHIGNTLVRTLVAKGYAVRAVVVEPAPHLEGLGVEIIRGDVRDPEGLREAFLGVDWVFHLAALISITGDDEAALYETNVKGTRNMAELALECGVGRFIHFSSVHGYSLFGGRAPIDEGSPSALGDCRAGLYDRSKALSEREVRQVAAAGLDVVIINPTGCIGPNDYGMSLMGEVFLRLYEGTLPAVVNGGFNWVDVRDVAEAAVELARKGSSGENYLIGGHWASIAQLARHVEAITGRPAPGFICPYWLAYGVSPFVLAFSRWIRQRPFFTPEVIRTLRGNRVVSHQKVAHAVGYKPRPTAETIVDLFGWFKKEGHLNKRDPKEDLLRAVPIPIPMTGTENSLASQGHGFVL